MKWSFIFLLFLSTFAIAQNVDYTKIVLPDGTSTDDFAEKLVQLAWKNNPANEIVKRNVSIAQLDVKKSGVQWLDIFSAQGNLNEFNLNSEADVNDRSTFYPRYNFGARVTFGMFFTIPYDVKQNKERVLISQAEVNSQKLAVRVAVLKAYNTYMIRERIYQLSTQATLDSENSYRLLEQRFKNGESSFESYNNSLINFNRASILRLEAEQDYLNAKVELEALIGVKLEDVR